MPLAVPGRARAFAGDPDPSLEARLVINAAGLGAQAIARMSPETPEGFVPPLHYAKGSYFDLAGRSPFSHLVYPLPSPGGLGVHLTIDMAGRARFGTDVHWVEEPDFPVDPARSAAFYRSEEHTSELQSLLRISYAVSCSKKKHT